jgi:hypothetical protein
VSLIPVAAALVRQAAADENYSQDLHDAARDDPAAFEGLVRGPIEEAELRWLSPSEWLWFARWRQDLGGPLDGRVLGHLDVALAAASRASRFDFRGLVMRDPASNVAAVEATSRQAGRQDPGLRWAERHAQNFPDSLEVARDALQYATPVAWFTVRVLTSLEDARAQDVNDWLDQVADQRQIGPEVTDWWRFTG